MDPLLLPAAVATNLVTTSSTASLSSLQHDGSSGRRRRRHGRHHARGYPLASTFASDGSEYSSRDGGRNDDGDDGSLDFTLYGKKTENDDDDNMLDDDEDGMADAPTIELSPIPMSKNAGNRFVAIVWDRLLDQKGRDTMELFYDRIELTEEHVMFCRKANLYNETFNTESMVDILWSLPMYVYMISLFC